MITALIIVAALVLINVAQWFGIRYEYRRAGEQYRKMLADFQAK